MKLDLRYPTQHGQFEAVESHPAAARGSSARSARGSREPRSCSTRQPVPARSVRGSRDPPNNSQFSTDASTAKPTQYAASEGRTAASQQQPRRPGSGRSNLHSQQSETVGARESPADAASEARIEASQVRTAVQQPRRPGRGRSDLHSQQNETIEAREPSSSSSLRSLGSTGHSRTE